MQRNRPGINARATLARRLEALESSLPVAGQYTNRFDVNHESHFALVNVWVRSAQCLQSSLCSKRLKVSAAVTHAPIRKFCERRHIRLILPLFRVNAQNLRASGSPWQAKQQLAIESPWATQGGVNRIDAICRADYHDASSAVQAIHESKQGRNDRVVDLILLGAPYGRQAVNLIKENDARLVAFCLVEKHAQRSLSLAHPFGQHIGALSHEEGHLLPRARRGCCECTCHERFPRARRPVQQHATRRAETECLEHLRVHERQKYHLLERGDMPP